MNPAAADLFPGHLALSVVGAVGCWLLALLLGACVLRLRPDDDPGGRILSWLVLGIAVQSQLWLLIGFAGRLWPAVVLSVAALLLIVAGLLGGKPVLSALREVGSHAGRGSELQAPDFTSLRRAAVAAFGLFLLCVGRLALWPSVFYDDLVYHLGVPRQALLTGSWPSMPGLHYSFMPAGWDAVYVLPLAAGGGGGPQLMNVVALGLFSWAVYRLARRAASPAAAASAMALMAIAPMTGSLGAFAGNDLFVGLALCVALERLLATRGERPVLVGLLAGAAWGAKYSALPAAVGIALAAALLRRGSFLQRAGGAVVVAAVTALLPIAWTVRTYALTGNPVYPAFYGLLGGRFWNADSAAAVAEQVSHGGLSDRGLAAFALALRDLLLRSEGLGFPGGINPLFALLGLAGLLLWRRVPDAGPMLTVAGVAYVGWCATSLNLRYALILLAVLAVFAAALIDACTTWLFRRQSLPLMRWAMPVLLLLAVAGPFVDAVRIHLRLYGSDTAFIGGTSRSEMHVTRLHLAAAGRSMAQGLPREARILLVGEGRVGLLPRPASASSAYDVPDIARLVEGASNVSELNRKLSSFTHVVVNFRELRRFQDNYGFAERFEPAGWELFQTWLSEGLEPVARFGSVVVFSVPGGAA